MQATEQWLASAAPETVSIHVQLLGAGDAQRLENYLQKIAKVVDIQQVFVYRTKAGGKPAVSVLYGAFPDRQQANQAMQQLPPDLDVQRPYVRTVQGVRAEIGKRGKS